MERHAYIGKGRNTEKGEKYRKRDKGRQKSEKEKATNKGIEGAQFEALGVKCGTS